MYYYIINIQLLHHYHVIITSLFHIGITGNYELIITFFFSFLIFSLLHYYYPLSLLLPTPSGQLAHLCSSAHILVGSFSIVLIMSWTSVKHSKSVSKSVQLESVRLTQGIMPASAQQPLPAGLSGSVSKLVFINLDEQIISLTETQIH